MIITFSKNPIIKLQVKLMDIKEEYTHWYWHKKPHYTKCQICGKVMCSTTDHASPEECGWENTGGKWGWICHSCLYHRDYRPYVELASLEEELKYPTYDPDYYSTLINKRINILNKLKSIQYSYPKKNQPLHILRLKGFKLKMPKK